MSRVFVGSALLVIFSKVAEISRQCLQGGYNYGEELEKQHKKDSTGRLYLRALFNESALQYGSKWRPL